MHAMLKPLIPTNMKRQAKPDLEQSINQTTTVMEKNDVLSKES